MLTLQLGGSIRCGDSTSWTRSCYGSTLVQKLHQAFLNLRISQSTHLIKRWAIVKKILQTHHGQFPWLSPSRFQRHLQAIQVSTSWLFTAGTGKSGQNWAQNASWHDIIYNEFFILTGTENWLTGNDVMRHELCISIFRHCIAYYRIIFQSVVSSA